MIQSIRVEISRTAGRGKMDKSGPSSVESSRRQKGSQKGEDIKTQHKSTTYATYARTKVGLQAEAE